jgi:hypothetical protein
MAIGSLFLDIDFSGGIDFLGGIDYSIHLKEREGTCTR